MRKFYQRSIEGGKGDPAVSNEPLPPRGLFRRALGRVQGAEGQPKFESQPVSFYKCVTSLLYPLPPGGGGCVALVSVFAKNVLLTPVARLQRSALTDLEAKVARPAPPRQCSMAFNTRGCLFNICPNRID